MKKVIAVGVVVVCAVSISTTYFNSAKINDKIPVVANYTDTTLMADDIVRLTQLSLLNTNENGEIEYKGSAADIEQKYNSADDTTKITIKLDSSLKFSDSKDLSADDVIFSYYWLINEKSNRNSAVASLPFAGLDEFRYNSSKASAILAKAKTELEDPSDATKTLIADNIIKPFLTAQMEWAKSLYATGNRPDLTAKYASAKDLFSALYAPKEKFNSLNHDEAYVLSEVISEYGCDYDSLGYAYSGDYDYFKLEALKQAFETVSKTTDKGSAVTEISGIKKDGNNTVVITLKGYDASYIYDVCDIYVLPKHRYGNTSEVGANIDCTVGAGMYTVTESDEHEVKLKANAEYTGTRPQNTYITLKADATVSAEYTLSYDTDSYCYVGFNVNNVNVNSEPLSQASCDLRKNISKAFTDEDMSGIKISPAEYTIYICAGGAGDHPAMTRIKAAAEKLVSVGVKLNILDTDDESIMWQAVSSGKAQMWCGVWNEKTTPEFAQKYSSSSINTFDASSNPYKLNSPELDSMIKDYSSCKEIAKLSAKSTAIRNKIDTYAIEQTIYRKTNSISFLPKLKNPDKVFEKVNAKYDWTKVIGNIKIAE